VFVISLVNVGYKRHAVGHRQIHAKWQLHFVNRWEFGWAVKVDCYYWCAGRNFRCSDRAESFIYFKFV